MRSDSARPRAGLSPTTPMRLLCTARYANTLQRHLLRWVDLNCRPSAMRQRQVVRHRHSTEHPVLHSMEWPSMPPPTRCTATGITPPAVTHHRRTAKASRCTNNVSSDNLLPHGMVTLLTAWQTATTARATSNNRIHCARGFRFSSVGSYSLLCLIAKRPV